MSQSPNNLRITHGYEPKPNASLDEIRSRLRSALSGHSCREISRRTGAHPETVRRYLSDGHPSVEFVGAIAREYDISCDWLLLGRGTPLPRDHQECALREASLPRLLRGIADKLSGEDLEIVARPIANERLRMTDPRTRRSTARALDGIVSSASTST
ncbi:MAG: helix-turn-helix transcriptional regulator [Phycisphaerae bacterium]|nr:helix-turn-helix transcriptional regulator [Phycisphaerae bacterium]